jgi:hypothetical protein
MDSDDGLGFGLAWDEEQAQDEGQSDPLPEIAQDECAWQEQPSIFDYEPSDTLSPSAYTSPGAVEPLKILAMTFNTESVRFGESAEIGRESYGLDWESGLPMPALSCEAPTFLPKLAARIHQERPHLVVVGLQEEAKPGSYLLSHALPKALAPYYQTLERTRLMGLGLTTLTKWTVRGLRLAVLCRSDWWAAQRNAGFEIRAETREALCPGLNEWTRGKGGVALLLELPPAYGRVALVNMHLPFDSHSLASWRTRHEAVRAQASALEQLHAQLVLSGQPMPEHVVLMGDLNFRIDPFRNASDLGSITPQGMVDRVLNELAQRGPRSVCAERDELGQVLRSSEWLNGYREGVDDAGPCFWPTCKLKKQRRDEALSDDAAPADRLAWLQRNFTVQAAHGKRGPRTPGWADRILFRSYSQGRHGISSNDEHRVQCSAYERWDISALSDHAAVLAVITLAVQ